jgi:hypothetical protein
MLEEIKSKMENIEDPEVKQILDNMNNFIYPKFKILQEDILKDKPGMFEMIKIAKKFINDLKNDYNTEFQRDFEKDMNKLNDHMGLSQTDLLNAFKNFTVK